MPPSSSNNYRKAAQPTVADTAGRIAPRDTRLEAAVLGALMLEKDPYHMCACKSRGTSASTKPYRRSARRKAPSTC